MDETVSFEADIVPLFTEQDVQHMDRMGVRLKDFEYMSDPAHASRVQEVVANGEMPPEADGGPWPPEKVELFSRWMEGGYQP